MGFFCFLFLQKHKFRFRFTVTFGIIQNPFSPKDPTLEAKKLRRPFIFVLFFILICPPPLSTVPPSHWHLSQAFMKRLLTLCDVCCGRTEPFSHCWCLFLMHCSLLSCDWLLLSVFCVIWSQLLILTVVLVDGWVCNLPLPVMLWFHLSPSLNRCSFLFLWCVIFLHLLIHSSLGLKISTLVASYLRCAPVLLSLDV